MPAFSKYDDYDAIIEKKKEKYSVKFQNDFVSQRPKNDTHSQISKMVECETSMLLPDGSV